MSDANELISFIASMSGEGNLRVERRQAKHDIQHVEDIVIEMLRNARDAGADKVYLATTKEDGVRTLVFLDNGSGVPQDMQERIFDARVTSKLERTVGVFTVVAWHCFRSSRTPTKPVWLRPVSILVQPLR